MHKITGIVALALISLGACAETNIMAAEKRANEAATEAPQGSDRFAITAIRARYLAEGYLKAGRQTTTANDIAVGTAFLAAGAVVAGAVGNASDVALANRTSAGVGASMVATRGAPRDTVLAIYDGAERLSCIATAAHAGHLLIAADSAGTRDIAAALTDHAVTVARLETARRSVRKDTDFAALTKAIVDALPSVVTESISALNASKTAGRSSGLSLSEYKVMLDSCLAARAVQDPAPQASTPAPDPNP